MNQRKKILFITGTRADYGKIKPIMQKMEKKQEEYEVFVYVSGMHLLQKYGSTYREVQKDGYKNTYVAFEQVMTDNMSYNLGVVLMNRSGMRFLSLPICILYVMRKQKKDCFRWVSRKSVFL